MYNEINKLDSLRLSILLFLLSVALTIFLAKFAILPTINNIIDTKSSLKNLQKLNENRNGRDIVLENFKERRIILQEWYDYLTQGNKPAEDISGFVQNIYDIAWQTSGDKIKFTRTEPNCENQDSKSCKVIFYISSDYKNLMLFVQKLERYPFIAHIDGLSISKSENGKVETIMQITGFMK